MLFPPIPSWSGLHPLVVHFPIALLLVAIVGVVAGMIWWRNDRSAPLAAVGLMIVGTIGAWVAAASGEAAAELADRTPDISAVLHRHEELAELTRNIFTVLTAVYVVLLIAALALKQRVRT